MRPNIRLFVLLLACVCAFAGSIWAQGVAVAATKDDWEEINFVLDSSVLTDGFPSLLRLAELLNQNPDYTVALIGHADARGSNQYNQKLGRARAEAVRDYLVKNGVRPNQVTVSTQGETQPKAPNTSEENMFMNRRVTMLTRDGQGRLVSAAGIAPAIRALEQAKQQQQDCCEEVLKLLRDQKAALDAIKNLESDNERLRKELEAMREGQAALQRKIDEMPKAPQRPELEQITEAAAAKAIEAAKPKRFALLGLNIGPTLAEVVRNDPGSTAPRRILGAGNISFTGKGRYFAPFGKTEMHALQAEGEYMYYKDRQEGQFDIGLVNRYRGFQLGLFSSMKHANLTGLGGGTLGQAAMTADAVFSRGRIGLFGTKGYLTDRMIARTPVFTSAGVLRTNFIDEHLLMIVDQLGASALVGVWNDAYLEGNIGALFRKGGDNKPGGMIRLVHPFHPNFAFTVEAGVNETMVTAQNTGRLAFGVQFGNWVKPKEYGQMKHPVPADIPRVRYELVTRRVRTGNDAPVADAGPDQIGVQAGTVTLDGSGSFDPDGDALTYQWTQVGGPSVTLSNPTGQTTTFPAAEGNTYSFRLAVKDTQGAQGTDTVTVSVQAAPPVRIVRFAANPTAITAGQATTLSWEIENADTAEISGIGQVNPRAGTSSVSPNETTTYTLTARNQRGEVTEALTVTVARPQVRILTFQASPTSIVAGQSATLLWQTENADEVSISGGVGPVAASGTSSVSPTQTTTYTITARNRFGEATANATVQVNPVPLPTIVRFAAAPADIITGGTSTLCWEVQNATQIAIDQNIGNVGAAACQAVSPTATTTYTLTATNASGSVTQTATVTVTAPVRIVSFAAAPTTIAPGATATLTWTTENAVSASIAGVGSVQVNGSTAVTPAQTTTYTLIAIGNRGTQATATVTVTVQPGTGPTGLTCNAGAEVTTMSRTATLRGTGSDPSGPVTFFWTVVGPIQPVTFTGVDTATPTATFEDFGAYIFELEVTNSARQRCTARTTVNYIDP